jgi:hypothetical protein
MPAEYASGLEYVKLGDIEADGTMGETLVTLGNTVAGSMTFTTEEGTTTDFNIEEQDAPIKSNVQAGASRIAWECYDVSAQTMQKIFGGTVTGAGTELSPYVWQAPKKIVAKEQSIELRNAEGHILRIVRASVFPTINWGFTKDQLAKFAVSATILTPTADVAPFEIEYAPAA